jgi:hypothetical protein
MRTLILSLTALSIANTGVAQFEPPEPIGHPSAIVVAQVENKASSLGNKGKLSGKYIYEASDGKTVAELQALGKVFLGTVTTPSGNVISLMGSADSESNRASGTAMGSILGVGKFEATVEGDVLNLSLVKQGDTVPFVFYREGTTPGASQDTGTASQEVPASQEQSAPQEASVSEGATAQQSTPAVAPSGDIGDKRLIGAWVYQSMVSSGDASFASEQFLDFRADGSYSYGQGSTVAGGGGWSYDGGSGEGETERGYWRAQESILYLRGENGQWERIGKYGMTTDGQTMRITYDSGGKKLWSRR